MAVIVAVIVSSYSSGYAYICGRYVYEVIVFRILGYVEALDFKNANS